MELNYLDGIKIVVDILKKADGEDMDTIIKESGFEDYLLRSLMMKASDEELNNLIEERKSIWNNQKIFIK